MKKKPPKESNPTPKYDPQREENVLLEDIRRQVTAVAEGHGGLVQNINDIKVTLDEHGTRFDRIEAKLGEHNKRFDGIEAKLGEHNKRFDGIESAIIENSKDIKELKADVSQLKVGQERIEQKLDIVTADHEQRIQKLETTVR